MSDPHIPATSSKVKSVRSIDELLDRAVNALNSGDRATADVLAEQVLAVDRSNPDAEELLAAPVDGGEIRRLTMLFTDLVDSTAMSTRMEPEVYRTVVGRYRDEVLQLVNRYEGYIGARQGDGLLAVFGHPKAHENDARRAVQAGLDITRAIGRLSEQAQRRFGFDVAVRVGIHRGLVYLDTAEGEVYGLGANLAARICGLAEPGAVAVSDTIERLAQVAFELEAMQPRAVKGLDEPIVHYKVIAERETATASSGPLVGRETEAAYLQKCWAEAIEGTLATRGVAFKGEGGIGKTRLATAAVDAAAQSGAELLALFGSPFHEDVGLRPVRRLLERRCGIRRDSSPGDRLASLHAEIEKRSMDPAAMVPLLAPVLGIRPDSGYEPAYASGMKLYEQIAAGIHDYFLACLGTGPGLVLVEDMHWFDDDTIDVVQRLLAEDRGGLLVVITGRQLPPLPSTTQVFELKALTDGEADELIAALHPEMQPGARQEVRERCDGVPLYIEEVVAKVKEQPFDAIRSPQVPDTLYETLYARLRSSTNAVLVVEAAALIGSRIDQHLLSSVVDLDSREIADVLGELTRGRVLRPVGKDSWRFHHELLREVAAELSPPSLRHRLHSRIADALVAAAADGSPEWPLVAHHYELAERYDEAASAHEQASADARRRGALNEARTYLNRALQNIEGVAPSSARDKREIALRLESGFLASAATGHASGEAAAEFERCLQLIGDNPGRELYMTLSALWSYYTARGDLRRGTQVVQSLESTASVVSDIDRVATAAVAGALTTFRGDLRTARDTLERAAAAWEGVDNPGQNAWYAPNDPFAGMYSFLAITRFLQGNLSGAKEALERMEALCENLAFPHGAFSLCYGRSIDAWMHAEAGEFERGIDIATGIVELGYRYGFDEWVMVAGSEHAAGSALGAVAAADTDPTVFEAHIEAMTTVVETWRMYDVKTFLAFYDGVLVRVLTAAGKHQAARERADISLKMGADTWIQFYDAELLRLRAHTFDEPDERHAGFRAAIELARKQGALIFELRAAAEDFELIGDPGRAALAEALARFPADQTWPELARARALLE